ncbi:hypothetical protein RJ639_001745 [Escallonia herrerae]|uniref:sucrose synthase n=1 Tax=Escallonia herrerae TaxID=1293975 RepID=A0AA89BI74_9ASTE|nr:hypothetical protein RJ639_001745 [Escallonia herrerae]
MARMDNVKKLTGLVEWYAKNARLRELVNLIAVGGDRRKESKDLEEQAQMEVMYGLTEKYELNDEPTKERRALPNIVDTKGDFVQPALYEAFRPTVVESMTCGLPTFAIASWGPGQTYSERLFLRWFGNMGSKYISKSDRLEMSRYIEMFLLQDGYADEESPLQAESELSAAE